MNTDPVPEQDGRESWQLRALHGEGDGTELGITTDGLTIGRADSNDVVLPSDEFPGVSGSHVRVVLRGDEVFVEDLKSKNGTFVRGERITRQRLGHGDVFELGRGGPRYVVLSPSRANQTVLVTGTVVDKRRNMGSETVEIMREKLGIPALTKVTDVVQRENRRYRLLLYLVFGLLVAGGGYGVWVLRATERDVLDLQRRLHEQLTASRDQLDRHREEWRQRVLAMEAAHRESWDESKKSLLAERERLEAQLARRVSADELQKLQEKLAQTEKLLLQYDPISLEQRQLSIVSEVEHAVVLIEVEQTFVEPKTRKKLYIDRSGGTFSPNLEGKGELYSQETTGSGFCFSAEGWILTNAHVVMKKDAKSTLTLGPDLNFEADVKLDVVFSGTTQRHPATLHDHVASGTKDLALIRIRPFPGMPHLDGIDTSLPDPPRGTSVYLLGFPLGRRALQEGEKVIASAFRGIVSRKVTEYFQVDAAVHPGNSGGPVIDDKGRVVGVVVGMQRLDDSSSSSAIGYILPIALAVEVWPPKK